ncbi:hypothetical protein TCON_0728 [Astathelohania contejeani]|uniref:Uncharacterized protein n=1 Tax=Astathelohania contejeani TaxID=164912 RepID=A0ABQ7I131_9MICR|nr:hypothetical protein TCON_0728 [Thelohania contejeani]
MFRFFIILTILRSCYYDIVINDDVIDELIEIQAKIAINIGMVNKTLLTINTYTVSVDLYNTHKNDIITCLNSMKPREDLSLLLQEQIYIILNSETNYIYEVSHDIVWINYLNDIKIHICTNLKFIFHGMNLISNKQNQKHLKRIYNELKKLLNDIRFNEYHSYKLVNILHNLKLYDNKVLLFLNAHNAICYQLYMYFNNENNFKTKINNYSNY